MSAIWQNGHILCYGQAACDAAATYLKTYPSDTAGAAYVAANYCYIHPAACASYDRHRAIASAILLAGGTIAQGAYTGLGLGAAEIAGNAGDHILLGKSQGLAQMADKIGARTLMNDSEWQQSVLDAIANPDAKISVSLDGATGSGTSAQVMGAATRGLGGSGTPFDWEMAQLYSNDRLGSVSFLRGGSVVNNPFG
jgi:hypothetical protein